MLFFVLCTAVFCSSCKPINGPEGGEQGETSGDTINKPEDPKDLLMGEWYCVNNSNLTVAISDSLIHSSIMDNFVCRYTVDDKQLHLKRLWHEESEPYYNADCNYYLKDDTLHIENFIETYAAINPPKFTNIILVRSTSKQPNTAQCDHQCFVNDTISDAELTEMIRGPWWTDENSMDFGYIYSDDSLAIYMIDKEDFMAGICKFYHFRVKDGKIWFYTDEEIKEIEEPYGSNINFSTCFSLETNCLHIYRFTVDGSNFFPLTLRRY
jgi:hypothetical protein